MSVIHLDLNKFQIIPIADSARRERMSDDRYFSEEFSGYISNSRLKYIKPEDGGNIKLFKNPPKLNTNSLYTGRL